MKTPQKSEIEKYLLKLKVNFYLKGMGNKFTVKI